MWKTRNSVEKQILMINTHIFGIYSYEEWIAYSPLYRTHKLSKQWTHLSLHISQYHNPYHIFGAKYSYILFCRLKFCLSAIRATAFIRKYVAGTNKSTSRGSNQSHNANFAFAYKFCITFIAVKQSLSCVRIPMKFEAALVCKFFTTLIALIRLKLFLFVNSLQQ